MLKSVPKDHLLISRSLPPLHLSHQPGRAIDEELNQQYSGEAADEHPMSIEPGQGDCGEEGDPDKDDVGQVKVTAIIISLCHGVGHHSEELMINYGDFLTDILENIDGENTYEVRD